MSFSIKKTKTKNKAQELAQALYPETICLLDLGCLTGHVELMAVMGVICAWH